MANCPHCQIEYKPAIGQKGCHNCGELLEDSDSSAAGPIEVTDQTGSEPSTANNKVIGVGEGQTAGRDIIINETVDYCAVGRERLYRDRGQYSCSKCQKSPVCEAHFDAAKKICVTCVGELVTGKTVPCGFCGDRVPVDQAFTCRKCLKIGGPDHKSESQTREFCESCSMEWDRVVEDIENGKVGIGPGGTVVTREDVELKNGVVQDKEGRTVAMIKKQTWYARRRQWHTVKPQLLKREQHAMLRLYPDMEIGSTPDGDITWLGKLKTWTQKSYDVQLIYPMAFPFTPPRVFVISPKIARSRHIYEDGHLCLFHHDDKAWQPKTTAATMMSWVSLWLHCYEEWQETGNWPRPEADDFVITPNY